MDPMDTTSSNLSFNINTYLLLFEQRELPPDFFPNFDRVGGDEKYSAPSDRKSRRKIEGFTECEEEPYDYYLEEGLRDITTEQIVKLERFLNGRDPLHEIISEQDAAVAINTHFLRPAHSLFSSLPLNEPMSKGVATWEASLSLADIKYINEKNAESDLIVRPDVVYGRKKPGEDLDFGSGEPNLSRAFAILEFKRKALLTKFVADLRGMRKVPGSEGGAMARALSTHSTLFLKQVVAYCMAYRTQFVAMSDLDHLIFFRFHELTINANDTPVTLWNRGHGGKFRFTVLDKNQHAYKIVCYNGFLRTAVRETPSDS